MKTKKDKGTQITNFLFILIVLMLCVWNISLERRLPKEVCEIVEHKEFVVLNWSGDNFRIFEEGSGIVCQEGVEVNLFLSGYEVYFDILKYCGVWKVGFGVELEEYEECRDTEQRFCTVVWEEEVCEVEILGRRFK